MTERFSDQLRNRGTTLADAIRGLQVPQSTLKFPEKDPFHDQIKQMRESGRSIDQVKKAIDLSDAPDKEKTKSLAERIFSGFDELIGKALNQREKSSEQKAGELISAARSASEGIMAGAAMLDPSTYLQEGADEIKNPLLKGAANVGLLGLSLATPGPGEFMRGKKAVEKAKDVLDPLTTPVYKGETDLTTKILKQLEGKTKVSKQFIEDLTNQGAIRQPEKDLIRKTLQEYKDEVPVKEFANKVKTELLPLERNVLKSSRYESISLPEESRGPVASYNEHIYNSPIKTSAGDVHFSGEKIQRNLLTEEDAQALKKLKMERDNARYQLQRSGTSEKMREFYNKQQIETNRQIRSIERKMKVPITPNYFAHTRIEDLPVNAPREGLEIKYEGGDQWSVLDPNRNVLETFGGRGVGANAARKQAERYIAKSGGGGEKTRRVIELQSDLFQKGRLEQETFDVIPQKIVKAIGTVEGRMPTQEGLKRVPMDELRKRAAPGLRGGVEEFDSIVGATNRSQELSKLEPYRNTWHERVIREEVKQAAKDGKTKLQFPTGETALKIEGLGETNRNPWRSAFGDRLKPEDLKVGQSIENGMGADAKWIITDVLGDGKFKAVPKRELEIMNDSDLYKIARENHLIDKDENLRLDKAFSNKYFLDRYAEKYGEQFDISGKVDTNNPIYRFYEKEVGKYLSNKFGAKQITDPQGVKWWEVDVPKEAKKLPIEAFAVAPLLIPQKDE